MILKFLENLAVEDHPAPSYQLQLNQSLFNNEFSFENCGRTNFYYFLKFSTTKILKFGFPTFTQSIYQTIYCCLAWPNYQNSPKRRIHVQKCGLLTNCIQNWGLSTRRRYRGEINVLVDNDQRLVPMSMAHVVEGHFMPVTQLGSAVMFMYVGTVQGMTKM